MSQGWKDKTVGKALALHVAKHKQGDICWYYMMTEIELLFYLQDMCLNPCVISTPHVPSEFKINVWYKIKKLQAT